MGGRSGDLAKSKSKANPNDKYIEKVTYKETVGGQKFVVRTRYKKIGKKK